MLAGTQLNALDRATEWVNSGPLTADGLRGKVVVIDFWTFTCINWLRSLPYVRAWSETYADRGLVTIGVHTPEFAFEQDAERVRRAALDLQVPYPIVIDSDSAIWRAFDNHYWPALYFVDARGVVRDHHVGEGDDEASEAVIRRLLGEISGGALPDPVTVDPRGVEAPADRDSLRSPETYLGSQRAERFVAPGDAPRLALNQWSVSGGSMSEHATVLDAGGSITYHFHARDLHLVMGPGASGAPIRFRLLIDGEAPGADHGLDVDERGEGVLAAPRLYQLIRQRECVADRTVGIAFLEPGAHAYAFTFG